MRLQLYKRGDVWWARGSDAGRKWRKSTRHTSERKAQLVVARWERELADPAHFRAHQATVESAAKRWWREIRITMKPETVRFYGPKMRHVLRLLGPERLSKLTHDRILDFYEQRGEEGAAKNTRHQELTTLRLILKSAKRAGEFNADPRDVVPKVDPGYVPAEDWVEPHVVWAAIGDLLHERGAALAFVAGTACDFGNIPNQLREDIEPTKVWVRGTKTTTRARWVPRVSVFETFVRHAEAYALPGGPKDPLFGEWTNMARDVRRACRRMGVQEFTARTLRRSAATWMAKAGVPFPIAAKFMGHASLAMLLKVYAKFGVDDIGRAITERM